MTSSANTIYVISGLGANEKIFYYNDFSNFKPVFLPWLMYKRGEKLPHYAQRMTLQIPDANPVIVGLSFGGMLAIEIAKQMPCKKVILISSAKMRKEIPRLFRIAGKMGMHKLIPEFFFQNLTFITSWFLGTKTLEARELQLNMLRSMDKGFIRWGIGAITQWKNSEIPRNVIHIHGSRDRLLPIKNIKADFTIQNGGHCMVMHQHNEINQTLHQILNHE